MAVAVDRSPEARVKRKPHIFLSHSAKDKSFVRELAEQLNLLGIDAWFDEWDLQVGDSLYTAISQALETSRFVAIIISQNFLESKWAIDEMNLALSRERRERRSLILPLLIGDVHKPPFIEDRIHLDFRSDYYHALTRLAGMVHGISNIRIEDAIQKAKPRKLKGVEYALEYAGVELRIVLDSADCDEILRAGGQLEDGTIVFDVEEILETPELSGRVRALLEKWRNE